MQLGVIGNIGGAYTASKTALVGLSICILATAVVASSTVVDYLNYLAHPEQNFAVPYVPELFLLYAAIFGGIAGKNGLDNWSQVRKETQVEVAQMTTVTTRPTPNVNRRS